MGVDSAKARPVGAERGREPGAEEGGDEDDDEEEEEEEEGNGEEDEEEEDDDEEEEEGNGKEEQEEDEDDEGEEEEDEEEDKGDEDMEEDEDAEDTEQEVDDDYIDGNTPRRRSANDAGWARAFTKLVVRLRGGAARRHAAPTPRPLSVTVVEQPHRGRTCLLTNRPTDPPARRQRTAGIQAGARGLQRAEGLGRGPAAGRVGRCPPPSPNSHQICDSFHQIYTIVTTMYATFATTSPVGK
jgi:hypothetical protein